MKKYFLLISLYLVVNLVSGCAKPDHIMTTNSPIKGVFYTVEVFKADGPTSDTTRVYAHLERNGKTKKMLVLDGGNLTVARIIWNNPHDATLCLGGGITETFRNQVTLIVGDAPDDSETINNHLREHCDATSTNSPNVAN
jgi:hypothetical protein